jgi:hypothetical protein
MALPLCVCCSRAGPTQRWCRRLWASGDAPHCVASSDDIDVAEALIEGGAEIDAPAGSIAHGAPLDNAVGYACWRVARLLVDRGARVDKLCHAAALGMMTRTEELMQGASIEEINDAFWQACSGG